MEAVEPVIVTSKTRLEGAVETAAERGFEKALARLRTGSEDEPDPFAYVTNDKAMQLLGLSRSTLAEYRRTGLLPYAKLGSSVYYRRSDLEALLEDRLTRRTL